MIQKMMIDIHCHLLPNIDDGCKSTEDTKKTLKEFENMGFSKIILTPHYMEKSNYCSNNKEKTNLLNEVKKITDMDLYLGNEIYINSNISELIEEGEIYSLNNSRYLLIEFPLYSELNDVFDYLHELKVNGYVPIIAHPERYEYFQKDYKKAIDLYNSGVLFQCNYGSIVGIYGKRAKKLIKYLLKKDMVSFLGTDIHRCGSSIYENFDKIVKRIKKIIGNNKFSVITYSNPLKIIENEEING